MQTENLNARTAALNLLNSFEVHATSLISYQSGGRVIVIGDSQALQLCSSFPSPLTLTAIVSGQPDKLTGQVIALNNRSIEIQGYLGAFSVTLSDSQGNKEKYNADMIVDAGPEALLKTQLLPAGYLHMQINEQTIVHVQEQLLDMVGEFEKPKYFQYDASICAHGSNGMTVCTNCIDACPAQAITSLIETIEVDSHLCQGGGACASACPSGAIQYVYPGIVDSGNKIRKVLQSYHEHGGKDAVIFFHSEEQLDSEFVHKNPGLIPIQVEEVASVGMELCLSSLAYGASQVVLLANDDVPALSLKTINEQLEWLKALLEGLILDPERVNVIHQLDDFTPIDEPTVFEPALYTMPDNKRNAIFQALDHFYQQAEKTRELISLPAAAPFGSATIDENACTLCMACVGACPGKALQDGSNRELPEIFFIESNCIQCGTCTQTCPETAISISPRMIFDREKRNRSRVLNQDVPFACISCGKPFAPTSVIQKMNHKLKDHYMFKTSRSMNRLKMCEDCRVADIVQDPDAMNGNFDPQNTKTGNRLS